jgi:hypothetical protein
MKSWLLKFRISNALDDRRPLSPAVGQAITQSEEVRRFAENCSALDRALKNQLPKLAASASLHTSIMRAVRAAVPAPVAENQPAWPRWIPVSSLVLLILLGVFLAFQFFPNPGTKVQHADWHPLAAASSVLELGGNLVRETPAAAMSPLSDELQRLDRDLVNTEQFLFASLP